MANSIKTFNSITLISLGLMIFALTFSKSMLEICFMAALVSWLIARILSYKQGTPLINILKPPATPVNTSLYIFALVGFLSIFVSPSISLSLKAFFSKLLKMIVLYFIIVETVNTKKRYLFVLIMFLLSAIVTGADCIYQLMRGADLIRQYRTMGGAVTGPFDNQNNLAAWLTVAVPLLICLLYFGKNSISKKLVPLLFLTTLILLVSLVLTYTRGAWIAVTLSLILIGVLKRKKLAILTILAVILLFFFSTEAIKERTISIVSGAGSETHRVRLWREAESIIKDYPILGCGLNSYSIVAPKYKLEGGGGIYPHNCYLQMAAETGLLGLGAFLWIIVTIFKTALANLKKIKDKFYSAILIGLLAGLFAFLAHSFVDTNFYSLPFRYLMWFVIGLIVAVQRIALKEEGDPGAYNGCK